jgi:shikimate dehydrogenase
LKIIYGLIGYPLSHSFSAGFFKEKFETEKISGVEYHNYPLENISALPGLISSLPDLKGLNVTIPYKEKVIPFLDELSPVAQSIRAVNTIRISRSTEKPVLKGFNTDVYGFSRSLTGFLPPAHGIKHALILGTGGASKAVEYVLEKMGISFEFVSTSLSSARKYGELDYEIIKKSRLIINTTPLGTFPETSAFPPIPYEFLTKDHYLFDLVYNPPLTVFLKNAQAKGAATCNGLNMLVYQAERSWEIWNGREED